MTDKSENPRAFPAITDGKDALQWGMSLRDYFASAALQGFCAFRSNEQKDFSPTDCATDAYIMADAMLAARGRP